jgi:hypothetical protein
MLLRRAVLRQSAVLDHLTSLPIFGTVTKWESQFPFPGILNPAQSNLPNSGMNILNFQRVCRREMLQFHEKSNESQIAIKVDWRSEEDG